MAIREFIWRPLLETPSASQFRVLTAQFGDGYAQKVGDGINNKIDNWQLVFKGRETFIEEIKQFLDEHGGYLPFLWSPKMGAQALWDCSEYNRVNNTENDDDKGIWTLSATFNQRFYP